MIWKEKDFEEQMTPYIDEIYKGLFKGLRDIKRSQRNKNDSERTLFLDTELGIDTILMFEDGTTLTFQEKSRKSNYLKFDDFTFEYFNNPATKEPGEWFKLASQYYFYGFAKDNTKGYIKYYILKVPDFRLFLKNEIGINKLKSKYLKVNKPPAKASFFAIPFKNIPNKCFLHKSA